MHNTSPPVVWALLTAAIITPELTPCFAAAVLIFATAQGLIDKARTLSLSPRHTVAKG